MDQDHSDQEREQPTYQSRQGSNSNRSSSNSPPRHRDLQAQALAPATPARQQLMHVDHGQHHQSMDMGGDGYGEGDEDFSVSMDIDTGTPPYPQGTTADQDRAPSLHIETDPDPNISTAQDAASTSPYIPGSDSPACTRPEVGRGGLVADADLSHCADDSFLFPSGAAYSLTYNARGRPAFASPLARLQSEPTVSPTTSTTTASKRGAPDETPNAPLDLTGIPSSPQTSSPTAKRVRLGAGCGSAWDDVDRIDIKRLTDGDAWLNDSIVAAFSALAVCSVSHAQTVDPICLDDHGVDYDEDNVSRNENHTEDRSNEDGPEEQDWASPIRSAFEGGHATLLLGCVHTHAHWWSFEASPLSMSLRIYDSFPGPSTSSASSVPPPSSLPSAATPQQVANRLKPEVRRKMASLFAQVLPGASLGAWAVDATAPCAPQLNGNDCGIYSIVCLLRLATGADPSATISEQEATVWRMVMRALVEKTTCDSVIPWKLNSKIAAAEVAAARVLPAAACGGGVDHRNSEGGQQKQSAEDIDADDAVRPMIEGAIRVSQIYIKRYTERKKQAEDALVHIERIQQTLAPLAVAITKAQPQVVTMIELTSGEHFRIAQATDLLGRPFQTRPLAGHQEMLAKLEAQAKATRLAERAWRRRLGMQQASLERLNVLNLEDAIVKLGCAVAGYAGLIARQEEVIARLDCEKK